MTVNATTSHLAGLWPLFGLLIETPRLRLRLPREDELPALAEAARDIAGPDGPRLQMPWMYSDSPDMERQLLQRHWRALAHWKPASWHLPLAVFLAGEPVGVQDLWAEEFAKRRSVGTGSWVTRARQGLGYGTEARAAVLDLAFGHLGALEALTEYTEGNHGPNGSPAGSATSPTASAPPTATMPAPSPSTSSASTAPRGKTTPGATAPPSPASGRACPCSGCPPPGSRHEARATGRPRQYPDRAHPLRRHRDHRADIERVHTPPGPRARLGDRPGVASPP